MIGRTDREIHRAGEGVKQMRIGSRPFIAVLWITALVAALGGYVIGSAGLMWSSAVVASYALHLVAVESARRQSAPSDTSLESERRQLDAEREEVARLQREMHRQRAQAEEQWKLLREMVQERLQRNPDGPPPRAPSGEPNATVAGVREEMKRSGGRSEDSRNHMATGIDRDEPGRAYGRW